LKIFENIRKFLKIFENSGRFLTAEDGESFSHGLTLDSNFFSLTDWCIASRRFGRLILRQAPRFARNNRASDFAWAFAEAAADKWATPDKSPDKQDDKVVCD